MMIPVCWKASVQMKQPMHCVLGRLAAGVRMKQHTHMCKQTTMSTACRVAVVLTKQPSHCVLGSECAHEAARAYV
eukprot:1158508-Pelagomonas_calceolata.AAC.18